MTHASQLMTIADLRRAARRRIPLFIWEYLDSGTGTEASLRRNRTALDELLFWPSVFHGEVAPDLATELLGQTHALPFGIAPVGQSGLIWADAEKTLAQHAAQTGIPYGLSNVATETPETIGPLTGGRGWFQLYPPRDETIRLDMLDRVRASGFSALILTVDVPIGSRRERQVRGGLVQPPRLTPRIVGQCITKPVWALERARRGMTRMRTLDKYSDDDTPRDPTQHIGHLLRTAPDWGYITWLRKHWDGTLIVKGILRPQDAARLEAEGADAIWVSNHAGRQFDATPAAIEALPAVRAATRLPLLFDSGIESGLDILRAYALGADFVMLGRAWHYALGALGQSGAVHLTDLLRKDIIANLGQLGAAHPRDLRGKALRMQAGHAAHVTEG